MNRLKQFWERYFCGYGWYETTIIVDWTDLGAKRVEQTFRKWMTHDEAINLSMTTNYKITYSKDQSNHS
jgi:hypothetical protein